MTQGTKSNQVTDADTSFPPNFCSITMVFGVVLGCQLLGFVLLFAAGWQVGTFWERFSLLSLYLQWIGLVSTAVLCLMKKQLHRLHDIGAGLAAWAVLMLVTAAAAELALWVGQNYLSMNTPWTGTRWELLGRSLGVSGITTALILRYLYLDSQWRQQLTARSEARFQALQARIRPHFLFNSMNTVASLTRTDPPRAEALVENLADLFRAALSDPESHSNLGRELELIRHYLDVEVQRLGERLLVDWDIAELPLEAPLPHLMLQPLVENAVYHGIEPSPTGVIRIAGRYRNNRVNLSVRNTLPPTGSNTHRQGNRMAMDNTRQRLEAMYHKRCGLTVGRVENEYQVRLVFPYP